MNLSDFGDLARRRRSVRHFRPDPVPPHLLEEILDITRWAPSGYNLQPTHFVTIDDPLIKQRLHPACLRQSQILEAPVVILFAGNRDVYKNHFEEILRLDRDHAAIDATYEKLLRQLVPLSFARGPAGLGQALKTIAAPVLKLFMPLPNIPATHMRYWLAKQALLSAMVLMLAAEAAGLATGPMEGFDEERVKAAAGIPGHCTVPLIVALGYAAGQPPLKTRLPLSQLLHRNGW